MDALERYICISYSTNLATNSEFQKYSLSQKHFFFLTVGQNNFGNKIPFIVLVVVVCPVRDIKNRIIQSSNSPILEFKVLQNAFKSKNEA